MKVGKSVLLILLIVSIFVLPIETVHASGPTLIKKNFPSCGGPTSYYCSTSLSGATPSDFFIVVAMYGDRSGAIKSNPTFQIAASINITGSAIAMQTSQYWCDHVDNSTGFCGATSHSGYMNVGVFYAIISTAEPAMTITVHFATSNCMCGVITLLSYEVAGLSPQSVGDKQSNAMGYPGFYTGSTFSSFSTNVPSVYGAMTDFYAGGVIAETNAASSTATLESGYSNGEATTNFEDFPYGTAAVAIPTQFGVTYSGYTPSPAAVYGWAEVGVAFGVMTFGVSVVPCTFNQEQCWLYPSLVLGSIGGFFFSIGSAFRVSHKAMIYLFLSGLTFGSLVAMIMGIMTVMLPLLLIVANVFYSLRLHDRVFEAAKDVGERVRERATR